MKKAWDQVLWTAPWVLVSIGVWTAEFPPGAEWFAQGVIVFIYGLLSSLCPGKYG